MCIRDRIIEVQPFLTFSYSEIIVHTKLYGSYNQPNIAFSIAAGNYFGVETKDIVMALEAYEPENNRSQITQVGTNTTVSYTHLLYTPDFSTLIL